MEWSGDKVHVTETCDAEAVHLVTQVKACPAMQQDVTSTADLHARLAAKGKLPAEHFVDAAYVDAGRLVSRRRDPGVWLQGPVRGVANQCARGPGCGQRDIAIAWQRERVTCPPDNTAVTWRTARDDADAPRRAAPSGHGQPH